MRHGAEIVRQCVENVRHGAENVHSYIPTFLHSIIHHPLSIIH